MPQLCHKILVNVGRLTNADRGSLFLVEAVDEEEQQWSDDPDSSGTPYLVAKLFDVTVDSGKRMMMKAPHEVHPSLEDDDDEDDDDESPPLSLSLPRL